MATLIPPPPKKKAKLDKLNANNLNDPTPIPLPNIVVQLKDGRTGHLIGPSLSLPAHTDKKGLELIVNKLRKDTLQKRIKEDDGDDDDDDDRPWSFSLKLKHDITHKIRQVEEKSAVEEEDVRIPIYESLSKDLLLKHPSLVCTEDVLVIECEPEAIFRVREVRRCSSSLSGMYSPKSFSIHKITSLTSALDTE